MKNILKEKNDFASWVLIDSLGKLRFSKSSYYFIVIIPIIVKALDKVSSPLTLVFGENNIPINIDLPFSWYLFYFGAVAIALGSLLYQIFCPEIIKNYKNYGEFLASGESDNYLDRISDKYNISSSHLFLLGQPYLEQKIKEIVKVKPLSRRQEETIHEHEKIVDYKHNIKYQEDRKNAFNEIYDKTKLVKKYIRYTSFALYIGAFIAFGWVILQNICFVIYHVFWK